VRLLLLFSAFLISIGLVFTSINSWAQVPQDTRLLGQQLAWQKHLTQEAGEDEVNPVYDFYSDTEIQMEFSSHVIAKIKKNCFLNLHQLGSSGAVNNPIIRTEVEDTIAGYRLGKADELRPKYAYLALKKPLAGFSGAQIRAGAHGNAVAVFKDQVKARSTFTPFDSFSIQEAFDTPSFAHSFYYRPKELNFKASRFTYGYWEAQVWGKLCIEEDVEHFLINCGGAPVKPEELGEMLGTGKPVYDCHPEKYPGGALRPGRAL
jgi:hypothetical protein